MIKFIKNLLHKYSPKRRLDFTHPCCFKHQVKQYGIHLDTGENVEVQMHSGKTGVYKVTSNPNGYGNTGQRDWHFEFLCYKQSQEKENVR